MSGKNYAAFDFGAESGRAIIGTVENDRLSLKEIHRFPNKQLTIDGHIHWDAQYQFNEIKTGLRKMAKSGMDIQSIAIDTWGVDFGLLDVQGNLIENPYAYRDSRTDGMMDKVFERIPRRDVYNRTGIQFMQLNSLYQLYSMLGSPALEEADRLLFMPDLFNYMLCGEKVCEYTIASTSQMLNANDRKWDGELFDILGLPLRIMPSVVEPATIIGKLSPDIQSAIGMTTTDVIAVGSHDTASAVAAVPMSGKNCAYLSSGTWSLLGIESAEPIISDESYRFNFTNEGGVNKNYRFLKNTMGLWLLQQSRKSWQRQGEYYDYADLVQMAERAEPFYAVVNPDDASFLNPADMPQAIAAFCKKTGQSVPQEPGQFSRIILESLALKYRYIIEKINGMIKQPIEALHIVGGGSQNELLNQFTANALGIPVISGPVEATAIGNILVQLLAKGVIGSLEEGRAVVKNSFEQKEYLSQETKHWNDVFMNVKKWLKTN